MSGTSLDGVDAVLADFSVRPPTVLAHASTPMPSALKSEFLALNGSSDNELHRAALAGNALARLYAQSTAEVLRKAAVSPHQVRAIGAHGQTVRHRPQEFDGTGYTLQVNQPALLAELTGISVVADFRSRDVAAGGQGAPLVPPFHQSFFGSEDEPTVVLNIGGISNLTILGSVGQEALVGFDCGPGNALMDTWCKQHTGAEFDDEGRWGAQGKVHAGLLNTMLAEPFFAKAPPKSTGRDLFNTAWLSAMLTDFAELKPEDVQATLVELTALTSAHAVRTAAPDCHQLIVCGGGALNIELMARLKNALPAWRVVASDQRGLPPLQVEAMAFAWLARQTVLGQTASVTSVTGARGARILGAIYPA